jgi:hypothetical protein
MSTPDCEQMSKAGGQPVACLVGVPGTVEQVRVDPESGGGVRVAELSGHADRV